MHQHPGVRTYLFTDIEGSTRMWEESPERMRPALARHDAIARSAVERHHGVVVKKTGDGLHAVFDDAREAVNATLELQLAFADPQATAGVPLQIRCGLHAGADEPRDGDFYGTAVNRAARIMSTAHGGQVLVSQAVASMVGRELPPDAAFRELGAVRLRDLSSPERIYQLVHPKLREKFPALRSLEATPNNLPQQLTSFIGREQEVAEIKKLVAEFRLLTLLGFGGMGKSRLSIQAGADLLDDFPDGVWLVELAKLHDPHLVPQAVASVLGVKESAGRPVSEALARFFKDRRVLLILDNCEHLIDACAELARDLLQAGPHSKILASSREPLRISGETTYPVPALPASESERLFIDRALAAKPNFRVNGYAAAVSSICRRLDGIPLAIELAAARVRTIGLETIASRLDDRFKLLTSGDRTALPRQQTLRALIDWSHELLSEEERAVFRRLAVFAGGWTLDAAEGVVAFGNVEQSSVLHHVTQLADKSLIAVDAAGERYSLLETVRQYAYERVHQAHELDESRSRHLAYYLALAEKARPELAGPKQAEWLARLDQERENLLTAHAWCDRSKGGAQLGLRLAHLVKPYWFNRGLLGLGQRVTAEALARPDAAARNRARVDTLFGAGQFGLYMGQYEKARQYLEECLAAAKEIDHQGVMGLVLQPLGMAYIALGDLASARRFLEQGLSSARKLGERREVAAATNALAQLYRMEGALDAAERMYQDVLSIGRELEDQETIAIALLNLAMVAVERGEPEAARGMLLDVQAIVEETRSQATGQSLLEVSTGLAVLLSDWPNAARLYGAAEAQAAKSGMHRDPADAAFFNPRVAKARAACSPLVFEQAEKVGRELSYTEAIAQASQWLATARPASS